MITGGTATIYVSDMDRAVQFYVDLLGMTLAFRAGNEWAQLSAGGFAVGLHPASPNAPQPGARGAIQIGLKSDEPLAQLVPRLEQAGVRFFGPVRDDPPMRLAHFQDPDGNELYFAEMANTGWSGKR